MESEKCRTVLVLSEYLISIWVVDYSSLGLLSENKIGERKQFSVNRFLAHEKENEKSQMTRAKH